MILEQRKSGILLHPTSLPSPYGIGDLGKNARLFVDELKKAGQSIWQVLPLCPIGYGNSPYQSISVFAGNILLISPEILIEHGLLPPDGQNIPPFDKYHVDYDAVAAYKLPLLHQAYLQFQQAPERLCPDFAQYCKKNAYWLEDYALFQALHQHFLQERADGTKGEDWDNFVTQSKGILTEEKQLSYYTSASWVSWPQNLRKRHGQTLRKWTRLLAEQIEEEKFYQYLFASQWQALKAYANQNDIAIMGDAPIFTAYNSADVWANQDLFQLEQSGFPNVVAGVPPDYFCAEGQLWGNPLYDWKMQQKTDFAWWTARICKALEDVDYLRIDHFRAFESYWAVPFGAPNAMQGEWRKGPRMAFFEALEKQLGNLPLIAEDLGIITPEVRALRKQAGFPGMCILQFAFGNDKNNAYLPHNCDKNSIIYTGTHDNDTTIGWYQTATETEKDHYRRYMNVDGHDAAWDLIRLAMSSPAICAIIPMQDVLNLDSSHRMNTPGTASGNWAFRFDWSQWEAGYTEGLSYLSALFGRNQITQNDTSKQDDPYTETEEQK